MSLHPDFHLSSTRNFPHFFSCHFGCWSLSCRHVYVLDRLSALPGGYMLSYSMSHVCIYPLAWVNHGQTSVHPLAMDNSSSLPVNTTVSNNKQYNGITTGPPKGGAVITVMTLNPFRASLYLILHLNHVPAYFQPTTMFLSDITTTRPCVHVLLQPPKTRSIVNYGFIFITRSLRIHAPHTSISEENIKTKQNKKR